MTLTKHELIQLLLKATDWELYATDEELFRMTMLEAKTAVLNRLISQT
jgi:hypothetical protein